MNEQKQKNIGQILLDFSFITDKQLEHAVMSQQYINHTMPLGKILVSLGYITQPQLDAALIIREHLKKTQNPGSKN